MECFITETFSKEFKKLDKSIRTKLLKQIDKILENPEIGKPLRYNSKGERTTYVKPYRLIYKFENNLVTLLKFEHRNEVYKI